MPVMGKKNIEMDSKKIEWRNVDFVCLGRIGTNGVFFLNRLMKFSESWLAKQLLTSHVAVCSVDIVVE